MLLCLAKHISNLTCTGFVVILKDVEKTGIDISRKEGQRVGDCKGKEGLGERGGRREKDRMGDGREE